jgi:quercetin 2,3-dioxygenase
MIAIRRAAERGRTDWGWLDSRHTFSFGDYHDPAHMGFRALRVINDDRVAAGGGFPTHSHRDMEILSYVLEGALAHKDSMGTGSVIRPGEIQLMRAGAGVSHSEFNGSKTEPLHFLQVWIVSDARGLPPAYGQHAIDQNAARRGLALLASSDGRDGSLGLHQDVDLLMTLLGPGVRRELRTRAGRHAYIHVARGAASVNGKALHEGDGAAISDEAGVALEGPATGEAEVLVFDLA